MGGIMVWTIVAATAALAIVIMGCARMVSHEITTTIHRTAEFDRQERGRLARDIRNEIDEGAARLAKSQQRRQTESELQDLPF